MRGRDRRRALVATASGTVLVVVLIAAAIVGAVPARAGTSSAKGRTSTSSAKGQTVDTTINLPALVLDNLCNADVVNLSGDLHIRTTTTPRGNGGFTVTSSASATGLRGTRIAPTPEIRYRGDDVENTFSYYAPPPYPSTHRVVHWTRLIPSAKAPSMYLVLVLRETITADGRAVPTFERAYLVCSQPSCSSERIT
jgi:hypothetical protein